MVSYFKHELIFEKKKFFILSMWKLTYATVFGDAAIPHWLSRINIPNCICHIFWPRLMARRIALCSTPE